MDLLANENFPVFSIKLLRNAGHNVISVIEETPGAKDEAVLKRAHDENRTVLTFDRDYGELIYRHKSLTPAGAEILLNALEKGKVSISGRFTVIERDRIRQRTLR